MSSIRAISDLYDPERLRQEPEVARVVQKYGVEWVALNFRDMGVPEEPPPEPSATSSVPTSPGTPSR